MVEWQCYSQFREWMVASRPWRYVPYPLHQDLQKLHGINVFVFDGNFHVLMVKFLQTSSADVVLWELDEPFDRKAHSDSKPTHFTYDRGCGVRCCSSCAPNRATIGPYTHVALSKSTLQSTIPLSLLVNRSIPSMVAHMDCGGLAVLLPMLETDGGRLI